MLNYFSSLTVFGVIRLSYSECNHNVTEIARFSKGDFGNVHCNTESVDSNTDWTQVWCDGTLNFMIEKWVWDFFTKTYILTIFQRL